jgi:hypothetical protein
MLVKHRRRRGKGAGHGGSSSTRILMRALRLQSVVRFRQPLGWAGYWHRRPLPTRFGMGLPHSQALAQGLQERKISSSELVEHTIARIQELDKHLNAVVVRDFDRAREAAKAADAARARGDRRALLGIPMTVKESFTSAINRAARSVRRGASAAALAPLRIERTRPNATDRSKRAAEPQAPPRANSLLVPRAAILNWICRI